MVKRRINTLLKLEEERLKAKERFVVHQTCVKRWFDKKSVGVKNFDVGELVLKWDKAQEDKGKQMKFWSIHHEKNISHNTFNMKTLDASLLINGQDMKHYF